MMQMIDHLVMVILIIMVLLHEQRLNAVATCLKLLFKKRKI